MKEVLCIPIRWNWTFEHFFLKISKNVTFLFLNKIEEEEEERRSFERQGSNLVKEIFIFL